MKSKKTTITRGVYTLINQDKSFETLFLDTRELAGLKRSKKWKTKISFTKITEVIISVTIKI